MENRTLTPEVEALKVACVAGLVSTDTDIALASLSVLNEYRWLPYPTPPRDVKEYYAFPLDQKIKMNKNPDQYKSFWTNPEVYKFFETRLRIKNLNNRNKQWLEWMKDVLEESHPDQIVGINLKLLQFSESESTGVDQPEWNE